ncbi:MAG TPA: hypothetical protein VFD06_09440 [Candidatus Polarisedimenticolia bacterium]|nr:hypothetical protein [Candidatus Polarisedimenticolia bacterium]
MRGLLLVAAACALLLGAGTTLTAESPGNAALVVKVTPVTVVPGGRAESKITIEIQKGYRIVAPGTALKWSQPVLLAFDAADGVFVEPPAWPAGTSWRGEEQDPEVKVYEGRLDLRVTLRAAPKSAGQELALQGRLRYQAIKGEFFQKVAVMPVSIPVTVTAAPAAPAGDAATRP